MHICLIELDYLSFKALLTTKPNSTMGENGNNDSLGKLLREHRKAKGFTLRQVEDVTGISNAYLSQLENSKIQKPSANILYRLANLYRGNFNYYLEIAGIIEKQARTDQPKSLEGHVLYAEKLSSREEKELLRYLQFLRTEDETSRRGQD